jgi:hypothetical protein
MLQARRSRPDEMNEFISVFLIHPIALDPGVYSAFNRNEYQEQKNIFFLGNRA